MEGDSEEYLQELDEKMGLAAQHLRSMIRSLTAIETSIDMALRYV